MKDNIDNMTQDLDLVDLGDAATETKQPPMHGTDNIRDPGLIGF